MFFTVILLNLFSSYLIASITKRFLVIFLMFFSFVVINMEILSLYSAISPNNILVLSFLNFIFSYIFFKIKKAEFLKINFNIKRLKNSLILDKSLIILSVCFLSLLFITLFLAVVMPVLEPDSQTYHFIRAYDFIKFKSLNHFETNDIRALVMPINSEIIYAWMFLFKKTLHGYGILSYCSFLFFITSLWQILEKLKFCFRKRLFAIFVFSSFASVIVQIPSLQTDIVVGSLLSIAFCLFLDDKKINTYFSSLALALALGVKSTGVMSLLGFFVLIILFEKLINKTQDYKKIKIFAIFLALNFLVFSSYNYILNFIQFHNFLSNRCALIGHSFWGGIRGYIANLIRFCFQGLDFTGFKWGYYLNDKIFIVRDFCFDILNIPRDIGCNFEQLNINIFTDEHTTGFGILGFFVFIPMLFKSIIGYLFKSKKNKKITALFLFAITFIINILVLSGAMAYLVYSIRFIIAFVCLSAPILVYSYSKKGIYKNIIIFFSIFYIFFLPFCIKRMPFFKTYYLLKKNNFNMEKFSKDCYEGKLVPIYESGYVIHKTIQDKFKDKKNIAILKTTESSMLYLTTLENKDRRIDFLNSGLLNKEKLKKYDLIVMEKEFQDDNVFNPEDISIRYKKENNKIIFNDNKELNCFVEHFRRDTKIDDAVKRTCFTYYYFKNIDILKQEYKETIKDEQKTIEDINIYYFVNQIVDK